MFLEECGLLSGFIDVFTIVNKNIEQKTIAIADIDAAWSVRGGYNSKNSNDLPLETRFTRNESCGALRSLLSALTCTWVNREEIINFVSSNKFYQQQIAERCGLRTPRTLISNDPESVSIFSSQNKGLLLKSIGYIRLDDKGESFLYSQIVPHKEIVESSEAIRCCPIYSQEYVEKLFEHRVMVIGNTVLSCRIDSQASKATKIDWRHYDFDNVEHVQSYLPNEVCSKLLTFMREVGLQYGAIDLIETPDQEFVFLEVNPAGQWGWIADFAKLPIPEAVANMLESI